MRDLRYTYYTKDVVYLFPIIKDEISEPLGRFLYENSIFFAAHRLIPVNLEPTIFYCLVKDPRVFVFGFLRKVKI